MQVLPAGQTYVYDTLDGNASWIAESPPGKNLYITLVKEEHFGIYYCVATDSNDPDSKYVIKRALNYEGPTFGDMWPKYRRAAGIALGTCGGWVAFWIIGVSVYYLKFARDEDSKVMSLEETEVTSGIRTDHINQGFVGDTPVNTKIQDITDETRM